MYLVLFHCWIWDVVCVKLVFSCVFVRMITVCAHCLSLSHPIPLVPCLKYFLANSNMSYLLSCSTLSSRSPSANPSRETLWKSKFDSGKTMWHSNEFGGQKNNAVCECVPQSFDLSHVQPWWTPRRQRRLMTQRTVLLLLEALPCGPVAATRSQGEQSDGHIQPGTNRSGWTQPQTSNLTHMEQRDYGSHQPNHTKAHTPGFLVPLNHPQSWSLSVFPLTAGQCFISTSQIFICTPLSLIHKT